MQVACDLLGWDWNTWLGWVENPKETKRKGIYDNVSKSDNKQYTHILMDNEMQAL